ncbi:MAG: 3-dehydroquinate synthase [Lachnospiraceae bacterium]|nr:3-dehydroquinate synthase [Lachnospiraceae bacterium]
MKTIHVATGAPYDVIVGRGLLDKAGELLRDVLRPGDAMAARPCRAALIADSHVMPLYGKRVTASLQKAGFGCESYVFAAGEASKNLDTYTDILRFLAAEHFSRSDVIVALGGGVTGDMAGFAAATFLRGIPFLQIPTSLLAMTDSSVGGKTAVDLPEGKNLVGAFHQPCLVVCDPDVLETLPEAVFRDGSAEVIKYGMLGNEAFFRQLEEAPIRDQAENVIETCVTMKRDIVEADEFDTGERRKLNLGHSFGHAIEKCSNFGISHGLAVAAGMAIITRAAVQKGFCEPSALPRLLSLLKRCGLPTGTDFSAARLAAAALSDKKFSGGRIHLIVPEAIGRCRILPVPSAELADWLKAGGVL